jgi:exosome complex component MTR3
LLQQPSYINLILHRTSLFRFGPRESKKAMMYSDKGKLNCNVSYTTFATTVHGQVCEATASTIFYDTHLQTPIILLKLL